MFGASTQFAMAVHVAAALSTAPDRLASSAELSKTVVTNPAFLRVVLGHLRRAGLIETRRGPGGGSKLTRDARHISLLDVFRATEGEVALPAHDCSSTACPLGQAMPSLLRQLGSRIDAVVATELASITVAEIADAALGPEERRGISPAAP